MALILIYLSLIGSVTSVSHPHGIDFVGVGYNLLKGNPDGGDKSQGGVDPGLNDVRKIFHLSSGDVPKEIIYQKRLSCANVTSTYMFYGTKSYQEKLSFGIGSSGKGNDGLVGFSFGLSAGYSRVKSEFNKDKKIYQDFQDICNLGKARFAEELARVKNFSVTKNFAAAVCKLPNKYDTHSYMRFLDDWGTHVTTEVAVGTKVTKRYESSFTEFLKHVQKLGGFGLSFGGSYMGFGSSFGLNFQKFKSSDAFHLQIGRYQSTINSGSTSNPEPIHLTVKTLTAAFDPVYWRSHDVSSVCSQAKSSLPSKTSNILKALEGYAKYKLAGHPTDPELKIPVTWPSGTYGLAKSVAGCPQGRVTWNEGQRFFDTNDRLNHDSRSNPTNLAGVTGHSGGIALEFCMKGKSRISEFDSDWPAGDYCIYKYGSCPSGFSSGAIYWDDQNFKNKDHYSGSMPDGTYDRDTKIYFCCRKDGLPTDEIFLPTEKPFYLLRYTRECQHVHGMSAREEYVGWDDQHTLNRDKSEGARPFDDGGSHYHRLHFCYYFKPGTHILGYTQYHS